MTTTVYTDGACSGNPGPGGWAWAIPGGKFASGYAERTTNQRMEINAALDALQNIEGPVTVVSDSTYVVNCFRDRWWEGWLKRDWKTSAKKPVANQDLWEPLITLVNERKNVSWEWVKGHSGDPMNDLVDALAVEAGKLQRTRTGKGAPQIAKSTKPNGPVAPSGHLLLIAGHKPPELGGYGDNPTATKVRAKLREIIEAKSKMYDDLKVVTGLALGAEQLAAEAAIEAGADIVAVLPFPDQESVWPISSKKHYSNLLAKADAEVLLQSTVPDTKQAAGGALNRKNAWLSDHVDEAVVVWDGKDSQIEKFVHTLQEKLTEENVWIIEP